MPQTVSATQATYPRSPSAIAQEIQNLWPRSMPGRCYAGPYIDAMEALISWQDSYGVESAREIGLRFLCNAGPWRGADAKRIKNEIRSALGIALAK